MCYSYLIKDVIKVEQQNNIQCLCPECGKEIPPALIHEQKKSVCPECGKLLPCYGDIISFSSSSRGMMFGSERHMSIRRNFAYTSRMIRGSGPEKDLKDTITIDCRRDSSFNKGVVNFKIEEDIAVLNELVAVAEEECIIERGILAKNEPRFIVTDYSSGASIEFENYNVSPVELRYTDRFRDVICRVLNDAEKKAQSLPESERQDSEIYPAMPFFGLGGNPAADNQAFPLAEPVGNGYKCSCGFFSDGSAKFCSNCGKKLK